METSRKARLRIGMREPRGRFKKSSIRFSRSRFRERMMVAMRSTIAVALSFLPRMSPGMVCSVRPSTSIFAFVLGSTGRGTFVAIPFVRRSAMSKLVPVLGAVRAHGLPPRPSLLFIATNCAAVFFGEPGPAPAGRGMPDICTMATSESGERAFCLSSGDTAVCAPRRTFGSGGGQRTFWGPAIRLLERASYFHSKHKGSYMQALYIVWWLGCRRPTW